MSHCTLLCSPGCTAKQCSQARSRGVLLGSATSLVACAGRNGMPRLGRLHSAASPGRARSASAARQGARPQSAARGSAWPVASHGQ